MLGPEKAAGRAGRTANSGRHSTAPVRGRCFEAEGVGLGFRVWDLGLRV